MPETWHVPTHALALAVALALLVSAAAATPRPGRVAFMVLAVVAGGWTLLDLLTHLSEAQAARLWLLRGNVIVAGLVPVAWLWFTLALTERVPRRLAAALAASLAVPLVAAALTLAGPSGSGLMLRGVDLGGATTSGYFSFDPGPFFWAVHVPYAYGAVLVGILVLAFHATRATPTARKQLWLVATGLSLPVAVNVAAILGVIDASGRDLTGPSLIAALLALWWALGTGRRVHSPWVAYRHVFEAVSDAVLVLDREQRVIDANPAARALLRRSEPQQAPLAAVCPDLAAAAHHDGRHELDWGLGHHDLLVATIRDRVGRPQGSVLVLRDVSHVRARERHLRREADLDPLTGALNRRAFERALRSAVRDEPARPVTLAYLDVDHFKQVNDRFGHVAGDGALVEVTRHIEAFLRPGDLLGRLGGDEFALLFPGVAAEPGETIRARLDEALAAVLVGTGDETMVLSVSIGRATAPPEARDADALLRAADAAMYAAKSARREARAVGGGAVTRNAANASS